MQMSTLWDPRLPVMENSQHFALLCSPQEQGIAGGSLLGGRGALDIPTWVCVDVRTRGTFCGS